MHSCWCEQSEKQVRSRSTICQSCIHAHVHDCIHVLQTTVIRMHMKESVKYVTVKADALTKISDRQSVTAPALKLVWNWGQPMHCSNHHDQQAVSVC